MRRYIPLKEFVATKGGIRLAVGGGAARDRLVDWAIEDWPLGCPDDRLAEVIQARLKIRCRQQYGSVMGLFLLYVIAGIVSRLVAEWWLRKAAHRALIREWNAYAKTNP
jgi:hypothetical protein